MAESSKSTVLVTGAGGRTGSIFLLYALMGFPSSNSFFFRALDKEIKRENLDQKMTFHAFLFLFFGFFGVFFRGSAAEL